MNTTSRTVHISSGMLVDYLTGTDIRPATPQEIAKGREAAKADTQGRRTFRADLTQDEMDLLGGDL